MKHLDDDRNQPEDEQLYAWKDHINPDDMPDRWTVEDYEYPDHQLVRVDQVKFGIKSDLVQENYWKPYFTIGVQTFSLEGMEKDRALWYVEMLKIAFNKLTI